MAKKTETLERLEYSQIGNAAYRHGVLESSFGELLETFPTRFGYPAEPSGDARRELEGVATGLSISYYTKRSIARNEKLRSLVREIGGGDPEAALTTLRKERGGKLSAEVLRLNELFELSEREYYVLGGPTPMAHERLSVAKLAGFAVVDTDRQRESHIEPTVYASTIDEEIGLLPKNVTLHFAPLVFKSRY